ncbi:PAS domain S-box protein [Arenibacter sp. 6A1]|uniref:PAS domain S-box protein n=1 Tax=Arenibacter sp. 6A1 TaxID=2720391 RepID=UPI00144857D6|nr:PAS domain S-box protein [Arenibacter sp. 6A1]NKI25826.1 PAS domain S-box protein [Arenibacter sp. 6A1]
MAIQSVSALPSYSPLQLTSKSYDDICQLAAFICSSLSTEVALLEVPKHIYTPSEVTTLKETALEKLFKNHLRNTPNEIFIIENSEKDQRLSEKTASGTGSLPAFMAFVPILDKNEIVVGVLSIQDNTPKKLTPEQATALKVLARQALALLPPQEALQKTNDPKTEAALVEGAKTNALLTQKKIEKKIESADPGATSLIQAGYNLLSVIDAQGNFRFVGDALSFSIDYTSQELLETNIFSYVHLEDRDKAIYNFSQFLQGKPFTSMAYRIKHKSGRWKWFEIIVINMISDPDVQGVVINAKDITEKNELKHQLAISEEKYRLLFDLSPLPKYIYDIDSLHIIDVNEAMIKLYGYSRTEFLTMTAINLRPKEEVSKFIAATQKNKEQDSAIKFGVFTHKKKNGDLLRIEVTGHYLRYNNLNCLMVACKDVTEAEKRLQAIELSEQKLKQATTIAKLGYWSVDFPPHLPKWSDEIYNIWGRDKETNLNSFENFLSTIVEADRKVFLETNDDVFSGKKEQDCVFRIMQPNGQIKWIHCLGRLIKDAAGNPLRVEGTIQDITQQKKEEQELRLLESVVTHTKDAVMITEAEPFDEPGPRILYVNDAFTKMTGYTAEEVLGKSPRILQGPKSDKVALKKLGEAMRRWEPCETTVINYKKNGEEFWINFSLNPVADGSGWYTHWISIERDVTKQKNLELQKKLLTDISRLFSQQEDLYPCLRSVLQLIVSYKNFTIGEIWIPDTDNKQLQLVATYTEKDCGKIFYANSKEVQFFEKGEGLPGKVWEEQRLQKWEDLNKREDFVRRKATENSSLDIAVGIPLTHNQELVGILVVGLEKAMYHHSLEGELFEQISTYLGEEIKRKRLEIELDQIFKFAPDIICIAGKDGYFKKINPAATKILGYTEEELLSRPILEFIHPDDREITSQTYRPDNLQKEIKKFQNRYIAKNGETVWLNWNTSPAPDKGVTFAIADDITETKELQQLLDMANNLAEIGSWEMNLETNEIYWSEITKKIYEVAPNYQPTRESYINFQKDDKYFKRIANKVEAAINQGISIDYDMPIITAKGKERWVRVIGKPEFKDGKCVRFYGSIQNIQKLKLTQLALQKAFKENNRILESIGEAFISIDKNGVITYFNQQAEDYLGISRRKVVGQYLWDVIPKNNPIYAKYKNFENLLDKKKKINFEEYHPESKKWFELNIYPSNQGMSVFIKDVSERMEAEEKIKKSNERFEKVSQTTNDCILDWDISNNILFLSDAFTSLFGHNNSPGQNLEGLWDLYIHPEDSKTIMESLEKALHDPKINKWEAEYRFQKADGNYAYVLEKGIIIRNRKGKAVRMVGVMSDITYRKNYEESLKKLNRELKKHSLNIENQNKVLRDITWTQSHVVRAPVARLIGIVDLFKEDMLDAKEKEEMLDHILATTQEIDEIISDIVKKSESLSDMENLEKNTQE